MGPLTPETVRRILVYLGLALVLTWPMAADPLGTVAGHPEASVGCHVWVIWWAQQHLGPLHTDLIFYPYGADVVQLYGSDLLSPLLLGLLPLPPALLYNLWVITLLVLGAWGVDRLARYLKATPAGAMLGAVVFETAPFVQHELLNGTTEMLAAAALPWFCWSLMQVLDSPSRRRGMWLGGVVALGVAASAYNLFFMILLGTVILLHRLATRIDPVLDRPVLSSLAWGVLISSPMGVLLAWVHSMHGASELYTRRAQFDDPAQALPDSYASIEDWFSPRPIELPVMLEQSDGSSLEYWTTCTVFLGLVSLGLALATVIRRRALGPLGAAAVVAALIAMGPYLRFDGEPLMVGSLAISLPSLALAELIPPFQITALHAYRYGVIVVMGVAVLVAGSWRWRAPVATGVGVLILIESLWLSPVPWPAQTTPIPQSSTLEELANAPDGAVLQLPMRTDDLGELGRLLLAQTLHGHPVQDGGIHRRAGESATVLFRELPALNRLSDPTSRRIPDPRQSAWTLRELRAAGYRYVLVQADDTDGIYWATDNLGRPLSKDSSWSLWVMDDSSMASSAPTSSEGTLEP
jgi:hypothetical protein